MKNSKKSIYSLMKCLMLLLLGSLVIIGCQLKDTDYNTQNAICDTVTDIEGIYTCKGHCILTEKGKKVLTPMFPETDTIQLFQGATKDLYEVHIGGGGGFHEIELGALTGLTLRTATAMVSDSTYPVLEEFVFDTDPLCKAVSYVKIVRNPSFMNFKTCWVECVKNTD